MTLELEEPGELRCQPHGAWDYPMSRGEKIQRLLGVFQSEVECQDADLAAVKEENRVLREALTVNVVTKVEVDSMMQQNRVAAGQPVRNTEHLAESHHASRESAIENEIALDAADVPRHFTQSMTPEGRSPVLSPRGPPPMHKPRSRRRTTIFQLPHDQGTVRIPRCSAPPTFRDSPPAMIFSEPASQVWNEFGEDNDSDESVSRSFTPKHAYKKLEQAQTMRNDGSDGEEHEQSLITPDGIPIVLMENSCAVEMEGVAGYSANPAMEVVAGPNGFRPPRKSRLSIVVK